MATRIADGSGTATRTLLVCAGDDGRRWKEAFDAGGAGLRVRVWPDVPVAAGSDAPGVDYVAAWKPPDGLFAGLDRLRAVFVLGAGVERFLGRDDLPDSVPLVRLEDAGMAAQMVEYALMGVLDHQRQMPAYAMQQTRRRWQPRPARSRTEVRVSVLGLGAMGSAVAAELAAFGYRVSGWSRTPRPIADVRCVHGDDALDALLADTDVLVNLLPSTPATRGLLDAARLARLTRGAHVVHCGRGDQLDAGALLRLVERGALGGALLDVFAVEPLPADSRLWRHPRIRITPHVAAVTQWVRRWRRCSTTSAAARRGSRCAAWSSARAGTDPPPRRQALGVSRSRRAPSPSSSIHTAPSGPSTTARMRLSIG